MNAQTRIRHKLHNSLVALLAAAAIPVLALLAARPLPAPAAADALPMPEARAQVLPAAEPSVSVRATGDALEVTIESATDALEAETAEPRKPRKAHRRSRQTLAMPYFSFAAGS